MDSGKENESVYAALKTGIERAKDPKIDPLKDPRTVESIGQAVQLIAHDNYDRDNRLNGSPTNTTDVHGWKKIDSVKQDGDLTMGLWQKGDAVVATVLSVAGPGEAIGNKLREWIGSSDESHAQAHDKIAEWAKEHPQLVLIGHGDKGSTIALAEAQSRHLPAIALAPDAPGGLKLQKDAPVVSFDMSSSPVAGKDSYRTGGAGVVRTLDGSNVAGTGLRVASNFLDKIDVRGYDAAFGIGRVQNDPDATVKPVTEAAQPFGVRFFNNPIKSLEALYDNIVHGTTPADSRMESLNQAVDRAQDNEKRRASPSPDSSAPGPRSSNTPEPTPGAGRRPEFAASAHALDLNDTFERAVIGRTAAAPVEPAALPDIRKPPIQSAGLG